jgi:hypothetical protein
MKDQGWDVTSCSWIAETKAVRPFATAPRGRIQESKHGDLSCKFIGAFIFFARLRLCMAELGMINHDCLIIHIQYSLESTSRMGSRSLLLWSQQNRCCRKPTKQMSTLW